MPSTQKSPFVAKILPNRSVGLPSVIVCAIGFAIVLLSLGMLESAGVRRLQLVTSTVLSLVTFWLLATVSARHGLGRHVGYLVMLLGTFYWYLTPALALSLNNDILVTERHGLRLHSDSVATACLCIAGYALTSVFAYWFFHGRVDDRAHTKERYASWFYPIVVGLFLAGFVPYVLFGGGLDNVLNALQAGRAVEPPWKSGPLGDHRSALYYISRSGMVGAAGFAGTWAFLKRSRQRGVLLTIFFSTSALVFFDGGTRSWVALAVVPTAVAWLAFRFRERMTFGNVIVAILMVSVTQFAFEFARASRNLGWNMKALRSIDPIKREFDNDFFSELVVSVDLVPRRHDFFGFGDAWSFVSHPVPRFLWRDKPISPVLEYYNKVVVEGILGRANKLPSSIGQFYMSFGFFGVGLLGILSGWISSKASSLLCSPQVELAHVGGAIAAWWFLMARGVYPAWTYVVLFALLISAFGFRSVSSRKTDVDY